MRVRVRELVRLFLLRTTTTHSPPLLLLQRVIRRTVKATEIHSFAFVVPNMRFLLSATVRYRLDQSASSRFHADNKRRLFYFLEQQTESLSRRPTPHANKEQAAYCFEALVLPLFRRTF